MANFLALSVVVIPAVIAAVAYGCKPAEAPSASSESTLASAAATAATASAAVPATPAPVETSIVAAPPTARARVPVAPVTTVDPTTIQKLFDDTNHASRATLKAKGAAGDDPIAKALREFAKKVAPGMEADGPLATGTLSEKQSLQADVTLQPGKCYAIVGYSNKVRDLDLYLLLAPGILSGQDTTDDNTPVIGAPPQPMCPVAATAVTYKLGIVADRGAGDVAVQLYSKDK
jgi:hypothetical protein